MPELSKLRGGGDGEGRGSGRQGKERVNHEDTKVTKSVTKVRDCALREAQ